MSDWGKVPREVFMDRRLKPLDLRVFGILCAHANGKTGVCTRRQEALAADVDATRESVNRSLTRLVSLGYLAKRARAGMKRSLEYRVLIGTGEAGQLPLFGHAEAPRQAKPQTAKSRPKAGRKRDAQITSVVTQEVTSVVMSEITSNEQTPVNRTEPDGSAAARERAPQPARLVRIRLPHDDQAVEIEGKPRPANNDRRLPLSAAELDALEDSLRQAAGGAIDTASANMRILSEPLGWIEGGCELASDVLPVIARLASRHRGRPIRSWGYFGEAVKEAQERRLAAAAPRIRRTSTDPPSGPVVLGPHRPFAPDTGDHPHGSQLQSATRYDRGDHRRRSHAERNNEAFDIVFADVLRAGDADGA